MKHQTLIDQIKMMLKKGYADETIIYELKQFGNNEDVIHSALEIAKSEYSEESIKHQIKVNKAIHYAFMVLAIITFLLFMIVLPQFDVGVGHVFILSLIGSCFTAFFTFFAIVYYKSWDERFVRTTGKPNIDLSMMILMLIPVIILHFALSWRFSSAQESSLKNQQVEVIGRIVDGSSFQAKRVLRSGTIADFSTVTVEFETEEGRKMKVVKDISAYDFKDFYKDQQVRMVYSKSNPQNIDFLINEENIIKYKGTQERDVEPNDLLRLIVLNESQITIELNKISEGWMFDSKNHEWSNNSRKCKLILKHNQLSLVGMPELNLNYAYKLALMDFVRTSEKSAEDSDFSKEVFKSDKFIFTVEEDRAKWKSTITLSKL